MNTMDITLVVRVMHACLKNTIMITESRTFHKYNIHVPNDTSTMPVQNNLKFILGMAKICAIPWTHVRLQASVTMSLEFLSLCGKVSTSSVELKGESCFTCSDDACPGFIVLSGEVIVEKVYINNLWLDKQI